MKSKLSIVVVVLLAGVFASSSASAQKLELEDHSACQNPEGFPLLPEVDWRHDRSALIAKMGDPRHFARDAVTAEGSSVRLQAKFTNGATSKDIEDEKVRVLLKTCNEWVEAGEVLTDDDGWIDVEYKEALEPGIYQVMFQQIADGSYVKSKLWVLPKGTKVAVFDIDGTLTIGDDEAFREIADSVVDEGDYAPKAYAGGKALIEHYAQKGYFLMYLTGRPYWYKERTSAWLRAEGVAPGMLRLAPTHSDFWPSDGGVGEFKRAELEALKKEGLLLDVAHGNATTDIGAYLGAGLPKEKVWIIGKHAGEEGTQAVDRDWNEVIDVLGSEDDDL